jgi:hypothetical protein
MLKNSDLEYTLILEKLTALTSQEFLGLGADGLGYIKAMGMNDGKETYTLHAADGSHIATGQDVATLHIIARQNGLIPMAIH